jgi:hypothetical protein
LVLLQILGVHCHAADKENGTAGVVDRERHHRAKGKTRKLARLGGETANARDES